MKPKTQKKFRKKSRMTCKRKLPSTTNFKVKKSVLTWCQALNIKNPSAVQHLKEVIDNDWHFDCKVWLPPPQNLSYNTVYMNAPKWTSCSIILLLKRFLHWIKKNDQHFNSYGPDKNYTTAAVMKPSLNPSTPRIWLLILPPSCFTFPCK